MSGTISDDYLGDLLDDALDTNTWQQKEVPCTIYIRDGGPEFIVSELNSWGYVEDGVLATGKWGTDDPASESSRTVLIPLASIDYIEFDFARWKQLKEG